MGILTLLEDHEKRVNRDHHEIGVLLVRQRQKSQLDLVPLAGEVLTDQLFGVLEHLADEICDFNPKLALAHFHALLKETESDKDWDQARADEQLLSVDVALA